MNQRIMFYLLFAVMIMALGVALSGQSRTTLAQSPTNQPTLAVTRIVNATMSATKGPEPITAANISRIDRFGALESNIGLTFVWSPDSKMIAVARDIGIWLNSVENRNISRAESLLLQGHTDAVVSLAFSPDGKRLASGSLDKTLRLWDVQTGQTIATFRGHTGLVTGVAFSPNGLQLISISQDLTVRIWDIQTGQAVTTLQGHALPLTDGGFSPDTTLLAFGTWQNILVLWDLRDNKVQLLDQKSGQPTTTFASADIVCCIAFNSDGTQLISSNGKDTVRLWNVQTGQSTTILQGLTKASSFAFSPDGSLIAYGSSDTTVQLWDVRTGRSIATLQVYQIVGKVAFSPDGTRLAAIGMNGSVSVWAISSR